MAASSSTIDETFDVAEVREAFQIKILEMDKINNLFVYNYRHTLMKKLKTMEQLKAIMVHREENACLAKN